MFVSTQVTLSNNEKATVYYLDKEGYKVLSDAKETIYQAKWQIENLVYRVTTLESIVDTLKEKLTPQIKEWIDHEFLKHLTTMPTDHSFRAGDFTVPLMKKLNLHWKFRDILDEVFDETVKDGGIEERGSGWYRNRVSIRRT